MHFGMSWGEKLGYVFGFYAAYLVFTAALYFVLSSLDRLPVGWGLPHLAFVTFFVGVAGFLVRRWLS